MKLKNISAEELETMSYDDVAYEILKETGKKAKITDLFKNVCTLLNLSDAVYENQIGEFFQVLSTDQRFTMLDNGYWDLKTRHKSNIVMDLDDEEEEVPLNEEEETETEEEKEEEIYYDDEDVTDDDETDDDLKDLAIIDEDEEEKDIM